MESLLILFVLMCKHAVADLAIQSFRKPTTKRLYFNKGLHWHSLDHGILTFIVLLFWVSPISALGYAMLDYVAHWHIDWTKSNINHKFNIVLFPKKIRLSSSWESINQKLSAIFAKKIGLQGIKKQIWSSIKNFYHKFS